MGPVRLKDLLEERKTDVATAAAEIEITGLSADSRRIEPGYLFAALPGARADGRAYILDALKRGAAAVLAPLDTELPAEIGRTPVILDQNPRRRLALLAARFYRKQPKIIAAVTGTSGKTSTAHFARQLWTLLGFRAGSLGTLGVVAPGHDNPGELTTPDPIELHRLLAELAQGGIDHLAMEASSHGLDQFRLEGVKLKAAAFTNLSHDHLDYHGTLARYFRAKARLFEQLLPANGTAVLNADSDHFELLLAICKQRGLATIAFGKAGKDLTLVDQVLLPEGQRLTLEVFGQRMELIFPVAGGFQAYNALTALGLVIGTGSEPAEAAGKLAQLSGVHGRIELVARHPSGATILVDYSHKPEALRTILAELRPLARNRLVLVFGCGGDRDRAKRPVMGAIAAELADTVIVTDDNPRSEDPAAIRAAILAAAPGAREIGDRALAIRTAVSELEAGDLLVIAGKGHETGQKIGSVTLPFDDAEVARTAALALGGRSIGGGA
ncbi:UDP-N-acetylmuramoyl-L-alanyl-D-glutamate--2,6-diaminopimelate ligase [Hypericibacter adhaerens]|uniref:UDP-N-acetylmuramoyl-L-alanyl-D-glutamate--2,6-diaminopimelate ligase n=1 Tax=Hypericibacter adhaerens TaxID=2602016 RepID=A0A5J6MUA5_9PROT|nr:UDP-N-acetylmuramoyl-L-alanyl-D-glutamate--2,6-diaminopimelate ligase [Hypericibacter adhaerens]